MLPTAVGAVVMMMLEVYTWRYQRRPIIPARDREGGEDRHDDDTGAFSIPVGLSLRNSMSSRLGRSLARRSGDFPGSSGLALRREAAKAEVWV